MHQATGCRKIFIQLCLSIGLLASCYVARAQDVKDNNAEPPRHDQAREWALYPLIIQISPYGGFAMPLALLDLNDMLYKYKLVGIWGVSADVSLLYVRRSIWKHFDCYPRVGLMINYGRPLNQGHILSGLFYLEPNYNYLTGWELLTRVGIGAAYVQVPENHRWTKKTEGEEIPEIDAFRQGPSLALAWALLLKFRFNAQWHLHGGVNFDYLPYLRKEEPDERNRDLTILTALLGVSYTVNPSPHNYPRAQGPRKTSINVAMLHAFRKPDPSLVADDNKYYYVGGLHGQWSCQLVNNHALTVGTEWVKDWAAKKELDERVKKEDLKVSFLIGHEFLWGKLTFGQQVGAYILNDVITPPFGSFYTRLGLDYKLMSFLFIGVGLKTAILPTIEDWRNAKFTKTAWIDFRIGYSW